MQLLTATPVIVRAGEYNMYTAMSSGTSKLQYNIEGAGFIDIPDTSKTASEGINVTLPNCTVQSVLTGDATLYLNTIDDKGDKATELQQD
jgi:hypothetical protein